MKKSAYLTSAGFCVDTRHTGEYITNMELNWDNAKNEWLKRERKVSFEQVLVAIESGAIVDVLEHPDRIKYPEQIVILVKINDYIYAVPAVKDTIRDQFFMKTIYPSRKYTGLYLRERGTSK